MAAGTVTDWRREIQRAVARVAAASRTTHYGKVLPPDPERLREARQDLTTVRLEAAIDEALHGEFPLREDDRIRLAQILIAAWDDVI